MARIRRNLNRREFLKGAAATGAAALVSLHQLESLAVAASRSGRGHKRVLVLGIDGMSPALLSKYVGEGRMPNFSRLIRSGHYKPLRTSNPPQSPVAWSNFITGMNPGQHGIYDFIHRDPATMTPYLSTSQTVPPSAVLPIGGWRLPLWGGGVKLLRRGPAFWKILADRGIPCTLYRLPANFPPVECDARSLSGLGTPDLLGAYGVSTYVTDVRPANADELSDCHLTVVDMSEHECEVDLIGPQNTLRKDKAAATVKFAIYRSPTNPVAKILIQGKEILLNEGEWSDWVRVEFKMLSMLASTTGICRFYLKQVHPEFKLYISPINIDPESPALPISTPNDYARTLSKELGPFYTQGIAQDTKALSNGIFDEKGYYDHAMLILEERMRAYEHLLKNFRSGLLFFYISSLDLNSHMYWRAMDPRHPLYTEALGEQYGKTLEDLYCRMDGVLAKAVEHLDEDDTLIVLSDHGFQPFYRTFAVNAWLLENGYAALSDPGRRGTDKLFANTNWNKTYAYGIGINAIYLNLRGREQNGVIARGRQADMLIDEIVEKLRMEKDPDTDDAVFARVYKGRDIYHGQCEEQAPDIVLGFDRGYRASWDTILGTYEDKIVADNRDKWSGDHCMDVTGLSGVLLSNKTITSNAPTLKDLAPTILAEYGVSAPSGTEGRAILES